MSSLLLLCLSFFAAAQETADLQINFSGPREVESAQAKLTVQVFAREGGRETSVHEHVYTIDEVPTVEVPANTPLRVHAQLKALEDVPNCHPVGLEIEAIEAGFQGQARIWFRAKGPAFFLRCIDGETGAPLTGVRFDTGDNRMIIMGNPSIPNSLLAGIASNQQGEAVLPTIATDGYHGYTWVHTVLAGYSTAQLSLGPKHDSAEKRATARLFRSGSLQLKLAGLTLQPQDQLVLKRPDSNNFYRETQAMGYTAPGFIEVVGKAEQGGTWSFADVPSQVPLELVAMRDGEVLASYRSRLMWKPGEQKQLEWSFARHLVRGRVLDQDGKPVSGVEISLLSEVFQFAPETQQCFLGEGEKRFLEQSTSSNAAGEFEFAEIASGTWWVGLLPGQGSPSCAPVARLVELVPGANMEQVELNTWRGMTLQGVVLDPDGQPLSEGWVRAYSKDWGSLGTVYSNSQGKAALDALPGGEIYLVASAPNHGFADSEAVTMPAGAAEPFTLRLRAAAVVRGMVVDAATQEPCAALYLVSNSSGGMGWTNAGSDGLFESDDLLPGEWSLVASTEDGRVGVLPVSVEAGQTLEGLKIELKPGARLRLEASPSLAENARVVVRAEGIAVGLAEFGENGTALVTTPVGKVSFEIYDPELGGMRVLREVEVKEGDALIRLDEG